MKILHVIMTLNSVTGGGTVERTVQLHKALANLGADSHILTIKESVDSSEILQANDITYLSCLNARWFIPFPAISKVRSLVEQADVVHLMNHWTFINAWVYLLARKLNKPYIISPAGALTFFGRSKIKKYLYQRLIGKNILRNALAAIAISPHEVELFENVGIDSHKIHHIPNGVNDRDFSFSDTSIFRKAYSLAAVPYILFLGRINTIKGPDLLLAAFAKLRYDLPHHLVFAGPDGGMTDQLKKQILELNLIDRVHFTGHVGGDLKSSAYHGATLLVVPSRHEAMSIVALEAAISSTPVLLTDQCGFSSLAEAGAAIEVPATIEGLSKGLEKLLIEDCNLEQMGQNGRKFALERFSWAIMAKRFLELAELIKR